jgi:hypothetical protein
MKIGFRQHSLADGAQTGLKIKKCSLAQCTIAGKNKIDKISPKK